MNTRINKGLYSKPLEMFPKVEYNEHSRLFRHTIGRIQSFVKAAFFILTAFFSFLASIGNYVMFQHRASKTCWNFTKLTTRAVLKNLFSSIVAPKNHTLNLSSSLKTMTYFAKNHIYYETAIWSYKHTKKLAKHTKRA